MRTLFLSLLIAFAGLTQAASVSERSPFAQGHWWDPVHPGSGFDIFNADGHVMAVWYTYDAGGRPIWYTAGGDVTDLGQKAWPLLKHQWLNGRKMDGTVVGSLRLNVRHPESMEVVWQVNGEPGSTLIQPFQVSGILNEVDHTGSWYDRANSGWGIS